MERESDIQIGVHPDPFFHIFHPEFVVGEFFVVGDEFDVSSVALFAVSGALRNQFAPGEYRFFEFAVPHAARLEKT